MLLFSIIEILYFVTVLSADNIPSTTEKAHSLQLETDVTPKPGVHISELFKSNARLVNATEQIFQNRPIALEGGSSVVANDTKTSETNSPKRQGENIPSLMTSKDKVSDVSSNYSKTVHKAAIQTEGGLLVPVSTAQVDEAAKLAASGSADFMKDSFQPNDGEESDHPSVVPRKGVSKIVPRKGAEPYEQFAAINDNTEIQSLSCNCCEIHSTAQSNNYTTDPKCASCCNISGNEKSHNSVASLNNSRGDNSNNVGNSSNGVDFKTADNNSIDLKTETTAFNVSNYTFNEYDVYKTSPPLKKKSKPLVTLDDDTEPKQQKFPQSSSSEKNDFVIPVVFVILAVPIVVVLAMLFYRKGTEFWERRHYSRMDFLIDGMYNE